MNRQLIQTRHIIQQQKYEIRKLKEKVPISQKTKIRESNQTPKKSLVIAGASIIVASVIVASIVASIIVASVLGVVGSYPFNIIAISAFACPLFMHGKTIYEWLQNKK